MRRDRIRGARHGRSTAPRRKQAARWLGAAVAGRRVRSSRTPPRCGGSGSSVAFGRWCEPAAVAGREIEPPSRAEAAAVAPMEGADVDASHGAHTRHAAAVWGLLWSLLARPALTACVGSNRAALWQAARSSPPRVQRRPLSRRWKGQASMHHTVRVGAALWRFGVSYGRFWHAPAHRACCRLKSRCLWLGREIEVVSRSEAAAAAPMDGTDGHPSNDAQCTGCAAEAVSRRRAVHLLVNACMVVSV